MSITAKLTISITLFLYRTHTRTCTSSPYQQEYSFSVKMNEYFESRAWPNITPRGIITHPTQAGRDRDGENN